MTRSDAYVFKKKVDQNLFFLRTMNCIFGSKKKIVKQFILSFKTKKKDFNFVHLYIKNHFSLKNYLPLNVYPNSFC